MTITGDASERSHAHLRLSSAWYCYRARVPSSAAQYEEGETLAVDDIDFVEHETGISQNSHILEIGCSWGRHSIELAKRGYSRVTSLDVCSEMIDCARERATSIGYTLDFQVMDYLDYRTDTPFDVILSLYDRTCLGQPDEEQDQNSLEHLASMLVPGGYLLFGIRDWPRDLPAPSHHWEETEKGRELHEVLVNKSTRQCVHRIQPERATGDHEVYDLTRVHYTLPEVQAHLASAHFQMINAYHAFDHRRPYGPENDGLVVVARRI